MVKKNKNKSKQEEKSLQQAHKHTFTAGNVMDQWLLAGTASCIYAHTQTLPQEKYQASHAVLGHTVNPLCKLFTAG